MTWKEVYQFAASNSLAIHKPYCGYHRLVKITDSKGNPVSWTSNKARLAMQSLQAIVKQKEELEALSTAEIIILANEYHSSLY